MYNAIFELRQRRFFSRVIFSSPEFPGMPFSFTKIDHWCIFPLEVEAAGRGREGVGSSGVGSSGERRNPGAGLAAGREDVQRNI